MVQRTAVKVFLLSWSVLALIAQASAASPAGSVSGASAARAAYRRPVLKRKAEIEISGTQFVALDRRQGNWTGYVRGLGEVHLVLTISDRAGVKIRRYMGSVNLVPRDPRIKFNYITALPKLTGWSWVVNAYTV